MITEIKIDYEIKKLIIELEKIYNTYFKLIYNSRCEKFQYTWEVVYCETNIVFAHADSLEFLKEILNMYLERDVILVPQNK